jgi:hypothetical protein
MCFFFIASLQCETDTQYCSWRNMKFYVEPRSRGKKFDHPHNIGEGIQIIQLLIV